MTDRFRLYGKHPDFTVPVRIVFTAPPPSTPFAAPVLFRAEFFDARSGWWRDAGRAVTAWAREYLADHLHEAHDIAAVERARARHLPRRHRCLSIIQRPCLAPMRAAA